MLLFLAPADMSQAGDALSARYDAIRAPSDILANQIARQRIQAEINALERQENRLRNELRTTERLRIQDPISRLPAEEQALRRQLDRLDIDRRTAAAELNRLSRDSEVVVPQPWLPVAPGDPATRVSADNLPPVDAVTTEDAVAAARAFVEELLRANQARRGS